MIDDLQYPDVVSYHLWHIAASQHDPEVSLASVDPKWQLVGYKLAEVRLLVCSQECCGTNFSPIAQH